MAVARVTGRTPDGKVEVTLAQPIVSPDGSEVTKLTLFEDQLADLEMEGMNITGSKVNTSAIEDQDVAVEVQKAAKQEDEEYQTSAWDRFQYGRDKGTSDVENAGLWIESRIPLGNLDFDEEGLPIYRSPEELYGPEFMQMNPEERRKYLVNQRQRQVEIENQEIINANETGSFAEGVGEFVGMLESPTTLIPAFRIFKSNMLNLAGFGALFGAEYDTLHQLANKGEVDPVEVGKASAISAVATPVLAKSIEKVARLVSTPGPKTGKELEQADKAVDAINESLARAKVQGLDDQATMTLVRKETGLQEGQILQVAQKAEKPITPPANADEAKKIIEARDIIADPITARVKYPWWDKALSNISYDLQRESAPIALALRNHERLIHKESSEYLKKLQPFFEDFANLPPKVRKEINVMLRNQDFDGARALAQKNSLYTFRGFDQVKNVLDDLSGRANKAGYNMGYVDNYFPSKVKDIDGLRQALTGKQRGMIESAIAKRAKQLNVSSAEVPTTDRITITNSIISGHKPVFSGTGFSFAKGRTLDRVTAKEIDYYADPIESLHDYVRQTVSNINKRRFFGTAAKNKSATDINVDASVGALVQRELAAGRISENQADKISNILKIRFNSGEEMPAGFIQVMRNAGYLGTLADVVSATKQLADLGVSAYMNGLRHTVAALFGKKNVDMRDFGLLDVVAQEYGTAEKMASTLTKYFQRSGFSRIDRLGKDVFLNAAYKRGRSMAQSAKGQRKLEGELRPIFGDETNALINDLRAGNITENVKLYLWNQLSEAQPISLAEMPYAYLSVPNGRIFYQMKSFSIKQLTNMRNQARQEFNKGNYLTGIRNATGLAVALGVSGATVDEVIDFMLSQTASPEDIPDGVVENLLGLVGASKYVRDKGLTEGPAQAALTNLTPPIFGLIDSAARDIGTLASEDGITEDSVVRSLRALPIVGQLLYNYFGGGLERALETEFREQND